jgi:Family of unknown function (DUF6459)
MPSAPTPDPAAGTPAGPRPDSPPMPPGAFGGLRLIEVPVHWPPYDCEVHGTACLTAHEVIVTSPCADLEPEAAEPSGPSGPSGEFSAGRAGGRAAGRADPAGGRADPAIVWSRQFAQVIVEILAGARSPRQLTPWTTERVQARIGQLSQTLIPGEKPRIRRIVTSRPAARVIEMTIVLGFGPRSRALALRLEHLPPRRSAPGLPGRPARWLCTEIETG